jgi:hypothetical protein
METTTKGATKHEEHGPGNGVGRRFNNPRGRDVEDVAQDDAEKDSRAREEGQYACGGFNYRLGAV